MADRPIDGAGHESEPKVRVLPPDRVYGHTGTPPTEGEPQGPGLRSSRVLSVAAAIILVLGAGIYGYRLGAENRRAPSDLESPAVAPVVPPSTTTAPPTARTTTDSTVSFEETITQFTQDNPGHEVPDDTTEYLDGNQIAALAIDPDGHLWSAGPGGVVRWNPEDGSYTRLTTTNGEGPVDVGGLAVAPNGDVWVATPDGVSRWDGTEWGASGAPRSFRGEIEGSTLTVTTDGSVWVASVEWPIDELPEDTPRFRIHRSREEFAGAIETYLAPSWIEWLEAAPDGSLWAKVEGEIWRFADEAWQLAIERSLFEIQGVAFEPDGTVLLAGENTVRRWHDGEITELYAMSTAIEEDDGLVTPLRIDGWAAAVAVDANGIGWVLARTWDETEGERAELIRLDDQSRHAVPHVNHFTDTMVAVDGTIWVGGNGVSGFDGAAWSHHRIHGDPPLGWGESIAVDQDGGLWLGTGEGIVTFDGEAWSTVTRRDVGLPAVETTQWAWGGPQTWVAGGADGVLWVGFGCDVALREDGEWTALDRPPGLGDTEWCWPGPQSVAPDGSLWMGIEGVLGHRVFHADVSGWSEVARAPQEWLSALTVASDGTVWIASDGIMRLDGEVWITVLGGVEVETLTVGGDGTVWAAEPCWQCPEHRARLWHLEDGVWTAGDANINADRLATAPDGTVWAIGERDHASQGLWRHEAQGVFRRVVAGNDLIGFGIGPDGSLWVTAQGRVLHIER